MPCRIGGLPSEEFQACLNPSSPSVGKWGSNHWVSYFNVSRYPFLAVLINRLAYFSLHHFSVYPNNVFLFGRFKSHDFDELENLQQFQIVQQIYELFSSCPECQAGELQDLESRLTEVGKKFVKPGHDIVLDPDASPAAKTSKSPTALDISKDTLSKGDSDKKMEIALDAAMVYLEGRHAIIDQALHAMVECTKAMTGNKSDAQLQQFETILKGTGRFATLRAILADPSIRNDPVIAKFRDKLTATDRKFGDKLTPLDLQHVISHVYQKLKSAIEHLYQDILGIEQQRMNDLELHVNTLIPLFFQCNRLSNLIDDLEFKIHDQSIYGRTQRLYSKNEDALRQELQQAQTDLSKISREFIDKATFHPYEIRWLEEKCQSSDLLAHLKQDLDALTKGREFLMLQDKLSSQLTALINAIEAYEHTKGLMGIKPSTKDQMIDDLKDNMRIGFKILYRELHQPNILQSANLPKNFDSLDLFEQLNLVISKSCPSLKQRNETLIKLIVEQQLKTELSQAIQDALKEDPSPDDLSKVENPPIEERKTPAPPPAPPPSSAPPPPALPGSKQANPGQQNASKKKQDPKTPKAADQQPLAPKVRAPDFLNQIRVGIKLNHVTPAPKDQKGGSKSTNKEDQTANVLDQIKTGTKLNHVTPAPKDQKAGLRNYKELSDLLHMGIIKWEQVTDEEKKELNTGQITALTLTAAMAARRAVIGPEKKQESDQIWDD